MLFLQYTTTEGKTGQSLFQKYHSGAAREEVIKQLLPETYQDALKMENLDAVALPEITDVNLDSVSLRYKAKIELRPDIEVKNYKKANYFSELHQSIEQLEQGKIVIKRP